MSFLKSKTKVGTIVRVTGGLLLDKYVMIAKEYEDTKDHVEGYGVVPEPSDWPSAVPTSYNAIFVRKDRALELSEEEQTLLKIKFPNPDQFE